MRDSHAEISITTKQEADHVEAGCSDHVLSLDGSYIDFSSSNLFTEDGVELGRVTQRFTS